MKLGKPTKANIPRIMFAAFHSGSGKTTITCAVLKALMNKGVKPAAFKCGPDYIDPMFHTEIVGVKSRNLDLFMLTEDIVKYLFVENAQGTQVALLEGVMGYYDGLGANSTIASSYHLAAVTNTPVILVVNCKGSSLSLAALIKGFVQFKNDSRISGVILNNLSPALYSLYKNMIENEAGVEVVGYFPWVQEGTLGSRHLGLITAAEIEDLQDRIDRLAQQAIDSIDLEKLLQIAQKTEALEYRDLQIETKADHITSKNNEILIAVAHDKAFCFYYQDSLNLLEKIGAKIIPFSPLEDEAIPMCDGLILGGGYPEVFAKQLTQNKSMRQSIRDALDKGLPCMAECGGYMYLQQQLIDSKGDQYPMVGFLQGEAFMTDKLNRFGYVKLVSNGDNLLCGKDHIIHAHEFHYSDSTMSGSGFTAMKPTTGKQWDCIYTSESIVAGYPHFHLWGNISFAYNFINKCKGFRDRKKLE